MVDSCIAGTITLVISTALVIAVEWPLALAALATAFTGYLAWRSPASLEQAATRLDRRHGLSDLLSSAWAVRDRDEPWAASLRSIAEAQAAALPPSPWPGRWTFRRSACGLAMAGVALLLTQLIPISLAQSTTNTSLKVASDARSTESQWIADAHQRTGDTASSESRLPSEHESTASGSSAAEANRSPAKDAAGNGQAESNEKSSIKLASSGKADSPPSSNIGGGALAESGRTGGTAGAVIQSNSTGHNVEAVDSTKSTTNHTATHRPDAPPQAGYRDLISDFFAR